MRQPEWWKGDKEYHAAAYTEPVSELERRLKAGEFVVTSEVAPPQTIATKKLIQNIELIKPYVASINFTDCPSATPRMSSWACSTIAVQNGAEPVMQIAARDRTRVGLAGRGAGRQRAGRAQHPVPVRRQHEDGARAARQDGYRRRGRGPDAVDPAPHARRRHLPGWAHDEIPAQILPGRGCLAFCLRAQIPGSPRAQENQCRGAVLPDQPGLRPGWAGCLAERAGQAGYPG